VALGLVVAFALGALVALALPWARGVWRRSQILDSGGPLIAEQAAYDVRRYELEIRLEPRRRAIAGAATITAAALAPLDELWLDLDRRLHVSSVAVDGRATTYRHRHGRLVVALAPPWSRGERHRVRIDYAGRPKVSPEPPWLDGFVWETSASGAPWIAVSTEIDGADIWLPVKDHPSDEPEEGASVELRVPAGLVGLSNGRLVERRTDADGGETSRWEVHYPINNYLLTVNAGEYAPIEERYHGADGTLDVPMTFWALPEHRVAARAMWRTAPGILASMARRYGEFPFLDDKIAMVDAPLVGMEHQTLIAYGDDFRIDDSGIDETLVHELAHEWWGNAVSAADWDDFWLQEGFATYAEALYVEDRDGEAAGRAYLETKRDEIANLRPLVTGRPRTAGEAYDDDIYVKGAWVLQSLRWTIGDAPFFDVLRHFAAPPYLYGLVTHDDLARLVGERAGRDLDGFWNRYLRRADPPAYRVERRAGDGEVCLAWDDPAFEVPLPVEIDGELRRIELPGGRGCFPLAPDAPVEVITAGRLLAVPAADG